MKVIYDPIDASGVATDFSVLEKKYGISIEKYYYSDCSLAKHKNLITLFSAVKKIKESDKNVAKF